MKKFGILMALCLGFSFLAPLNAAPKKAAVKAEKVVLVWPRYGKGVGSDWKFPIVALQLLLRRAGFYKSTLDGEWGAQTEKSVRAFQKSRRLKVDGIAGPQTWAKLVVPLKRGSRGDAVRAVQTILKNSGVESGESFYNAKIDGVFGFETERATREFQQIHALNDDGLVGLQTWCVLLGGEVKKAFYRPE